MRLDVLLETFDVHWGELVAAARTAEQVGIDGLWVNDHLAGGVQGAGHVLECWTVLSALAEAVPKLTLGPLVLNVANRDPGVLAVMAATLQEISGGRLMLGLGAGGGPETIYATEQVALGRSVPGDGERRDAVERAVAVMRQVWSGTVGAASGFLRPDPVPPVVVAGFGPRMAGVAGRVGGGFCAPLGPHFPALVAAAKRARASAGADADTLLVVGSLGAVPRDGDVLTEVGLDRLVVAVGRPLETSILRLGGFLSR